MADNRTTITCIDCNKPFSITEEEKKWYESKGFELPKRCSECRKKRRGNKDGRGKGRY